MFYTQYFVLTYPVLDNVLAFESVLVYHYDWDLLAFFGLDLIADPYLSYFFEKRGSRK